MAEIREIKHCQYLSCTKHKMTRSVWCHKHRPRCRRKCKCERCRNSWNGKMCEWAGCNEEFHCPSYKNFTMCEIHRNNHINEEDEFQPGMPVKSTCMIM
jgi:hypothetical protein